MSPEVAIASHACAHLGAIQVPIFSGFAAPAVAARLRDSEAKVVITADGSLRRGKRAGDEGGRGRGARRVAVGRARRRLAAARRRRPDAGRARRLLGRAGRRGSRASWRRSRSTPRRRTSSRTRRARPAGRRGSSTCRAASSSRSRARSPTRPTRTPDDTILFSTDMGWIMGPWTVVGGGAVGATLVFMEGAPDWPVDRLWTLCRAGARHGARLLADARSARSCSTASRRPTSRRCARSSRPASRGTPTRTAGSSSTSAAAAARSSTARAEPRSARASSRRRPAEPIKACSLGGPALGHGDGRRGRRGQLACAARSASSSAASRSPG